MPMAVEAFPFLGIVAVLGVLLAVLLGPLAALPAILLGLFIIWFFRDPERRSPQGEGIVLSPADGRVTAVETGPEGSRVSIFLSVFNCHINRAPVAGVITAAEYTPGRYRPAWDPRVSTENERNRLTIRSARGDYQVTQIAGILARRIVCRKKVGDVVGCGERFGMIRFGSRTDLFLPPGVDPVVRVGDRVHGGLTIVAREGA